MSRNEPLVPLKSSGHFSVAHVHAHWYIACRTAELKDKPLARRIFDIPLVLFRGDGGQPSALLDRCAHRNVPLSLGFVESERLVCGYHGWAYGRDGVCDKVPALCGEQSGKARRVARFPTKESQGFVWVFASSEVEPENEPYHFAKADDPTYTTVRHNAEMQGTLHANLENILDVPHTAFLHRGLFRGVKQNEITAIVRRSADRVEAEFLGEPRPAGVVGRILAPEGGEITHFDRFVLPSIAEVEYALGDKNHILITSALTPVSDFETKLHAVVSFRTRLPAAPLKAVMLPIAKKILKQDQAMLKEQAQALRKFGGEQFVSTDVDLLGPHIWRLLRQAERGDAPGEIFEQKVRLLA